ncbi:prepilin peptidase [Candidatus Dependentiae bacterium]|nr:prepilin peptidase [Candidatus Dependentiae bacterium]
MDILFFVVIVFSLCWGSFLNVVAFRTITDRPFFETRSSCIFCNKIIAWYDNIPVLSWILLNRRCRYCRKKISILYPFIEILTAILITALFYKIFAHGFYLNSIFSFFVHFIFFSALIIAVRTDLQDLVIPQAFSIWLVPLGLISAHLGFLKISFNQSLFGAIIGYGILWLVAFLFKFFTKKEGLGTGDMEIMALIGSFIGPLGVWITILIGSLTGLFIGGSYLLIAKKDQSEKIPFGPFLVLGAVVYFFFKYYFIYYSIPF